MNRKLLLLFIIVASITRVYGQCPNTVLYDLALTTTSSSPYWEHCIDNASDPDNFNLDLISPNDIHNYVVDFGDGQTASGALWPANTPITHNYSLGKYIIKVTETDNGCTKTITGTLVNDRKPGAAAEPPTLGSSGCVPKSLQFRNITTNASSFTKFEWNWGDGTTEMVPNTNVGQYISHTYQKGKAGCNMKVRITAYGLCDTSYAEYGPYDFWDVDTAAVAASDTVLCGGQLITFRDVSLYNCNLTQPRRIQWDLSEVGGPVTSWLAATAANRTKEYFISGTPGSVYTVHLADSNYCGISKSAVKVRIIAPPVAQPKPLHDSICTGQSAVFSNLSTGSANQYVWDFGDGSAPTTVGTTANQSHVYNAAGTYTIRLIARIKNSALCADTQSVKLVVLPSPTTNFTIHQDSICGNVSVTFTDNSSPDAVSWNWDFGNSVTRIGKGPWTINFGPGTYNVTLTTGNVLSCQRSKQKLFDVYPSVKPSMIADTVCQGFPTSFEDKSTVDFSSCASGFITREKWSNIAGTSIETLTSDPNFPNNPGLISNITDFFEGPQNIGDTYGTRIRGFICPPENGNYVFWVAGDDEAELWLSTDASVNHKVKIAFVSSGTSYRQWNKFTSQQSASIYLKAGQKYYVEVLHKEGGGSDHVSVGWKLPSGVFERPIPASRLSPYQEGNTITGWSWDFGNGSNGATVQNPDYMYQASGTYKVKLTVSTGKCSATDTFQVLVKGGPVASYALSDTAGCTPFAPAITNTSSGASSYKWSFGDGAKATSANPSHTYFNNGEDDEVHSMTLVAISPQGCSDTLTKKITVYPVVHPQFNFAPTGPQCSPAKLMFYNVTSTSLIPEYKWYIDKDSLVTSDSSISHSYINKTGVVYEDTVRLVATTSAGCKAEVKTSIFIFPETDVDIVVPSDNGCHPLKVSFSTSGPASFYAWDFGDGGTSIKPAPDHTFYNTSATDTVYRVRLVTKNAFLCADTSYKEILVHPKPAASLFGVSPPVITIPDTTVNLVNYTLGSWNYYWNFGDGTTSQVKDPLVHYYTVPGTYEISLGVSASGCSDTSRKTVTVLPGKPVASITGNGKGCRPLVVDFKIDVKFADTITVDFGDDNFKTFVKPFPLVVSHSYMRAGMFMPTLTATGPGGMTKVSNQDVLTVDEAPIASFTIKPKTVYTPDPAFFSNASSNAVTYLWDFGDGETSEEENPLHAYKNAGIYDVTLTAINAGGCKDVTKVPAAVAVEKGATILIPDAFTPSLAGPNGGNIHAGNLNDVFYPVLDNFTEFNMLIFNRWGDLIFESKDTDTGWDGYYNGKLCKEDVYVYKIRGKLPSGEVKEYTGDVTLIHK